MRGLTALADFWRVDNKHGLYPQKDSFIFSIYNYLLGQSLYTCFDKYVCVHRKNVYD